MTAVFRAVLFDLGMSTVVNERGKVMERLNMYLQRKILDWKRKSKCIMKVEKSNCLHISDLLRLAKRLDAREQIKK